MEHQRTSDRGHGEVTTQTGADLVDSDGGNLKGFSGNMDESYTTDSDRLFDESTSQGSSGFATGTDPDDRQSAMATATPIPIPEGSFPPAVMHGPNAVSMGTINQRGPTYTNPYTWGVTPVNTGHTQGTYGTNKGSHGLDTSMKTTAT